MKDRDIPILLTEARVPIAALLLLGAFWLGTRALPRPDTRAQRASTDVPVAGLSPSPAPALGAADGPELIAPAIGPGAGSSGARAGGALAQDAGQAPRFSRWPRNESVGQAPEASPWPRQIYSWQGIPPTSPWRSQETPSSADAPRVGAPWGPASPLPSGYEPANRSEQLERIAREADAFSRHGFHLAGRGAYFSARAEFISALRLVSQGLDSEFHTTAHSAKLAAALTALREVEDFLPGRSRLEADLDLAAIVAGHRTPVLRGTLCDGLTALGAVQQYLTFCQEQLAAAGGREVAASMALYGLGKLHAVLANQQGKDALAAAPKAVAFYQAALLVHAQNSLALNDLGVLLAQAGRYEEARIALEYGAAVRQQRETWHNLAKVYRQLGRPAWAQYAERQLAAMRMETPQGDAGRPGASGLVQWVDPSAFAQPGAAEAAAMPAAVSQAPNAPGSGQPKRISARLPDELFEKRK